MSKSFLSTRQFLSEYNQHKDKVCYVMNRSQPRSIVVPYSEEFEKAIEAVIEKEKLRKQLEEGHEEYKKGKTVSHKKVKKMFNIE